MKQKSVSFQFLLFVIGLITAVLIKPINIQKPEIPDNNQLQHHQGCSLIYYTDGTSMLGGNNEDYFNPLTKVWFIPAEAGSYGRVYFGFQDYRAQGGMNDQGLFFDALALDEGYLISTEGKQEYFGTLADKVLKECATVDCAIKIFDQYYNMEIWSWQFFFGDASGESAIIEPQSVIRQQGGYQVATNFLQSISPQEKLSDWRYKTAIEKLKKMDILSVEAMRDVLDAVHMENGVHTLYSNVYDLNNKLVYLYYFHNYIDVVILNLEEELAKGYHAYDLPSLFPSNPQAEKWAKPKIQEYDDLVKSRLDTSISQEILQAYAGEYEVLEGWGAPGEALTVIAQDKSIFLRFPDYHQHELFPVSTIDFSYVAFLEGEFAIAYDVHFGLNEDGQVLFLELRMGDQTFRANRIEVGAIVPPIFTPTPTETPAPTASVDVAIPTITTVIVTPEATVMETSFPIPIVLGLIIGLAIIVITIIVWAIIRKLR